MIIHSKHPAGMYLRVFHVGEELKFVTAIDSKTKQATHMRAGADGKVERAPVYGDNGIEHRVLAFASAFDEVRLMPHTPVEVRKDLTAKLTADGVRCDRDYEAPAP